MGTMRLDTDTQSKRPAIGADYLDIPDITTLSLSHLKGAQNAYLLSQNDDLFMGIRLNGKAPELPLTLEVSLLESVLEATSDIIQLDHTALSRLSLPESFGQSALLLQASHENTRSLLLIGSLAESWSADDIRLATLLQIQLKFLCQHSHNVAQQQETARLRDVLELVWQVVLEPVDIASSLRAIMLLLEEHLTGLDLALYLPAEGKLKLHYQIGYPTAAPELEVGEAMLGHRLAKHGLLHDSHALDYSDDAIVLPLFDQHATVAVLRIPNQPTPAPALLDFMWGLSELSHIMIEHLSLNRKARDAERRFRLLAEHMSDVVALHSFEGRFLYLSPSVKQNTDYQAHELIGQPVHRYIHPEDLPRFTQELAQLRQQPSVALSPYRFQHREGGYVWSEGNAYAVYSSAGRIDHIVSSTRNITERKNAEVQLEHSVQHDELTGLPNRSYFMQRLEKVIAAAQNNPSLRNAILFVDLDRFKVINDSLGHSVGDELLKDIAKRIQTCLQDSDMIARLAGDEFAILLENLKNNHDAKKMAEQIQNLLKEPFYIKGHEIFSAASIGMAFINNSGLSAEDLLRNADVAMYSAKKSGGANFTVFNPSMYESYVKRLSLESELRRAIDEDELFLTYQPIVDLRTRNIAGFEALLRWRHPEQGLIPPDKFIPIAEESGLILDIDRWVIKAGCKQLVIWDISYPSSSELFLSLNLSTRHLMLEHAAKDITELIRSYDVSPTRIKLEVTEGALMNNAEAGAAVLARLRAEGIKIQIDDFGTGYSSLSYLHKLPLDSLKIDRSFVMRMAGGKQDEEIIRTIMSLASSMGLDVVAEGIETPYQYERLGQMGCAYGQGYLIAKPLEVATVEKRFLQQNSITPVTSAALVQDT